MHFPSWSLIISQSPGNNLFKLTLFFSDSLSSKYRKASHFEAGANTVIPGCIKHRKSYVYAWFMPSGIPFLPLYSARYVNTKYY